MKLLPVTLLCVVYLHESISCPEDDPNLVRWSDHTNAWNGSPPRTNANVTITKSILLDEEPPTLWSITIKSGGKLVWDPKTSVHLKVHWIRVDGELHIGSETCPYIEFTRITFLGNVGENDLGAGGDKALFVTAGGTLEIHGAPKLSWTKLTKTANKLSSNNGLYVQQRDVTSGTVNKGLIVYEINPTTGKLINDVFFDFNVRSINLPQIVNNFVGFLNAIPNGNIVGIAVRKVLAPRSDISAALDAIESIAGQATGSSVLRPLVGSAYSLITKKGSPETTVENYDPWRTDNTTSVAESVAVIGDLYVNVTSLSHPSGVWTKNHVTLLVADDLSYRPILTLLDDAMSWKEGDKVIIASTDYDWKQAEEKTLIKCGNLCNKKQVRLSTPLKFAHYGEVYKNVDMRGEVGLLSRNILFDSADANGSTTTYGGNLKFLKGFKSIHIEGAEFFDLGQQEILGRYPIHFHMCEDVDQDEATRPWIKHNSIHHSNSRCVTIHGTHGVIIKDNVCYMTHGHAYFLEDGGEKRTVFDGNLGLGQEKGTLILSDTKPATFWITNPISYVRNNVAAGGDGRGYWYTYPRLPLPPSEDKGFMQMDEARHTAVYQFENNVAHSYKNHGIFVDNEFLPNTDATGYNKYRPVEDPIMHLQYKNSTDKPAIFNRLTAYKNSPRNGWFRGGLIKVTHASLSDSPNSLNIIKENDAVQFFESSVIIGDSPNVGEVAMVDGAPVSIGRSFPPMNQTNDMFLWRSGFTFNRGPVHVKDVYFDGFFNNKYYNMGAITLRGFEKHSPLHNVVNAKFGFSDPSEGNRVLIPTFDEDENGEDDVRSFRDSTHSVTNVDSTSVTVLAPKQFHMTYKCRERKNWNFAFCQHNFGKIEVVYEGENNLLTVTRDDDYLEARVNADQDMGASFLAILGEENSYSMFWEDEVPQKIVLIGEGVTRSEGVRVGLCLPPASEFTVLGRFPTSVRKWSVVASVDHLDASGKYFYDSATGYFAAFLQHNNDFSSDETGECPGDFCVRLIIQITSGDRSQTDCLDAVHSKFDLSPNVQRKRRSTRAASQIDTRELPATAQFPPMDWGAGITR